MLRILTTTLALLAVAGPAAAETRYLAYDAADRITQALTRGVTLEANRGLFGAISVRRIISTSQRGSADIRRGGPGAVRRALPAGSTESAIYHIEPEGDGRGLSRALCPGSEEVWLVAGRVRLARPLTLHAVGRWSDGAYRHCVQLNYDWRGEWAMPPAQALDDSGAPVGAPVGR
ncbi:MAG: hypothetical protein QME55_12580 [Brevundimonas sp.]|uniref:hypothetical protein n=1 Tax=Brevundimonas sp. TaxID=1871086 RepID=UPI002608AF78|nr:hypothetical protein [Brevundimonas sp.]MDI6625560.1 hypothetical protein [Brevundimonas sp.]MDQ7813875.1 hypothetical protein [Brevundimonas sp.]